MPCKIFHYHTTIHKTGHGSGSSEQHQPYPCVKQAHHDRRSFRVWSPLVYASHIPRYLTRTKEEKTTQFNLHIFPFHQTSPSPPERANTSRSTARITTSSSLSQRRHYYVRNHSAVRRKIVRKSTKYWLCNVRARARPRWLSHC